MTAHSHDSPRSAGQLEHAEDRKNGLSSSEMTAQSGNLDKRRRQYRKKREGAAAVEFAVVAPVFFLLVFGMIEYGRMVMVQQVLTNASREGARRAVLDGASATEVNTVVQSYLASASVNGANITIDPTAPETAAYGDPITVTVDIDFSNVSWLPAPMYLGNTKMTASSVMRRETAK